MLYFSCMPLILLYVKERVTFSGFFCVFCVFPKRASMNETVMLRHNYLHLRLDYCSLRLI